MEDMRSGTGHAAGSNTRGDRLHASRYSQAYWVLTQLRRSLEGIRDRFHAERRDHVLIDFGCGNMPYRPLFEPYVQSYVGCDLANNGMADRLIESISQLPQESGTVGLVLSTQVLEHVENPAAYLREAHRVLMPGGLLILSTHGAWRYHPDPTDYWRWTSAGLRKQVTDAGFEVVQFEALLGPVATSLQLLQDTTRGKLPYRLRKYYVLVMQYLVQWADRRCSDDERQADACVYVVVGAKRAATAGSPASS